jgi:hypothetical protein
MRLESATYDFGKSGSVYWESSSKQEGKTVWMVAVYLNNMSAFDVTTRSRPSMTNAMRLIKKCQNS